MLTGKCCTSYTPISDRVGRIQQIQEDPDVASTSVSSFLLFFSSVSPFYFFVLLFFLFPFYQTTNDPAPRVFFCAEHSEISGSYRMPWGSGELPNDEKESFQKSVQTYLVFSFQHVICFLLFLLSFSSCSFLFSSLFFL